MTSQVQSSEAVEWVYIAESDEPTIYETETPSHAHGQTFEAIESFFSSKAAAENPLQQPEQSDTSSDHDNAEYFGDQPDGDGETTSDGGGVIIDDRVPPEKAFEVFLGRNFPIRQSYDYSGTIYDPRPTTSTQQPNVVAPQPATSRSIHLQGAESKPERLARLIAEVDQLSAESGLSAGEPSSAAFNQLKDLRAQLRTIEQQASYIPPSRPIAILPTQADDAETASSTSEDGMEKEGKEEQPITVQLVSPNLATMSSLEQRVTALEACLDVTQLEANFKGTSLATLVEETRTRLSLVTDATLPDRLKADAKQIAQILRSELQTERGQDALRVATLLDKMQEWQPLVDSLPILIDRLTSVRHLHEEADHFVAAMNAMATQLQTLESRQSTNASLLKTVRNSLEVNMKSVNENIDILERRLNGADHPTSDTS